MRLTWEVVGEPPPCTIEAVLRVLLRVFWPLLLRRDVASGIVGGFTGRQPVTNARNIALPRFNSNYTVRLIKCSKVPGLLQNLYGDSCTVDFRGVKGRNFA